MILYGFISYQRLITDDGVLFPIWCEVLGNLMCSLTVLSIIGYGVYSIVDVIKNKKVTFQSFLIDVYWF